MPNSIALSLPQAEDLTRYNVNFLCEEEKGIKEFKKLAKSIYDELLEQKQAQHKPRQWYSLSRAWHWLSEDKELVRQYTRILQMEHLQAGDAFIEREWRKAHPPRPAGRPRGLVTDAQLRAVANARALALLMQHYKAAQTAPRRTLPQAARNGAAQ